MCDVQNTSDRAMQLDDKKERQSILNSGFTTAISNSWLMGNETDRLSLLAIKAKIVDDPLHVFSSWNDSIHFCQWQGVMCGRKHQRVIALDLQSSELVGSISPHLGNLSFLREVQLQNNSFGNEIPPEIEQVPVELGSLSKLETIIIRNNNLTRSISPFANLPSLLILSLANNYFDGNIPDGFGRLKNLQELILGINSLSGTIPPSLFNHSSLTRINSGFNVKCISTPLPITASKQTYWKDHNQIFGSIPPEIVNLVGLQSLLMQVNQLTGTIPIEIGKVQNLHKLILYSNSLSDLSQNQLSGSLPMEVAKLTNLGYLDVSKNLLWGEIPSTLGSCTSLETLRLGNNFFNGTIPSSLSFLRGLSVVPTQGVFSNASKISVVGNRLALVGCVFYLCRFRNRRKDTPSDSSKNSLLRVSYQTLVKATDGFSSFNLIGVGGFGSVYKGVIDGRIVAVKVLNLLRHGASKSFVSECEALRNIRHRNLVKVLTTCSTIDYQGHDFKALIYEFMVNGSLEEWLHPNPNEDLSNEEFRKLNLFQRLNIVIDIVCALNYLHNKGQTSIVHYDLKPSNILLDKDMTGHVGDFGLAKFLADNATHDLSTSETRSIGIRGTIGYTAPEYGMGSEISTYGDIYSFGILVLEMFTGKRPTDEIFKDGLSLHSFVKEALPGSASEISDPILFQTEGDEEEENSIRSEKDCGVLEFDT
ncbi:hypothetical protein TEA_029159 [Camellia sinensis var. sinensis]|uniref:non-specific serine/threonine protein kinase n=1 Tax=Camellia sinensis var. sinensis TaxID=542762 RepID=A0A4S4EAW7_CAMSN|nr:hypothetical protein TEA_029159 [Camellia sinensis var. sinensis]